MLANLMFISSQDMFFFIMQNHNHQAHHPFNHQHHHLWKLQMSVCRVLQLFDRSVRGATTEKQRTGRERGREREGGLHFRHFHRHRHQHQASSFQLLDFHFHCGGGGTISPPTVVITRHIIAHLGQFLIWCQGGGSWLELMQLSKTLNSNFTELFCQDLFPFEMFIVKIFNKEVSSDGLYDARSR